MHRQSQLITLTLDSAKPPANPPPSLRQAAVYLAQDRLVVERTLRVTPHQSADQLRLFSRWLGKAVDWLERQSGK